MLKAPLRPASRWPGARVAVLLGGAASLSWEVIWQLQASLALGVSALGTALALVATLGGMAIGSLAMGRFVRERGLSRPLRTYGLLEATIGVAGLLVLPGFSALEWLDSRLYGALPMLWPALHLLGVALLVLPATASMGASIPVFQLIARGGGPRVSVLYAFNTTGAALGVLAFSFVLLPSFGVTTVVLGLAGLNCAILALTLLLDRRSGEAGSSRAEGVGAATPPECADRSWGIDLLPRALVIVFVTGFATFGLEVAWFRSLTAAFRSTTHTFAIVLAAVLIPLALAARLVPWLRARGFGPGGLLCAAMVAVLLATPLVERMDLFAQALPGPYGARLALLLLLALAVLAPSMLLLGAPLPWLLEEFSDARRTAWLYATNTLGSVAGSLVAAWLLLPALGFARTAWLLAGGVGAAAMLVLAGRSRALGLGAGAAALALAVLTTSSLGRERVQISSGPRVGRILAYQEGPDSTVTVVEDERGNRRLLIDGFSASSESPGTAYMEWMGRLPALLHPDPRAALVIGFGTGQTTEALREEGPARVDVAEVNSAVLAMAKHFESNGRVLERPEVRAHAMDGRAWLRRTPARYDVVTIEPMPPYFAGSNALYSREFYTLVREKLAVGGIVAQWLPFHLVPPRFAVAIAATFMETFPDAILWIDPETRTGILLGRVMRGGPRLGSHWPGLDRPAERGLAPDRVREGVALHFDGLGRYVADGLSITDDNQELAYGLLQYVAGADRWHGRRGEMMRANLNRVRHYALGGG